MPSWLPRHVVASLTAELHCLGASAGHVAPADLGGPAGSSGDTDPRPMAVNGWPMVGQQLNNTQHVFVRCAYLDPNGVLFTSLAYSIVVIFGGSR